MRAPQRAGQAIARRTRKQLSARELAVIESVERFHYLSARQIEELPVPGPCDTTHRRAHQS